MSFFSSLNTHALIASFMGLTLVPGAWTLASAPITGLPNDAISGKAQRHYETRFDDSFPLRDAFRQGWAAVKFGAFGEMANGAIAGKDGILFTAEEFTAPQNTRDLAEALRLARVAVEAAGAELIPVIVPDKARMMSRSLPHARSERFTARYDHLLNTIASEGLRTVDLRLPLARPQAYMRTDTHWSPEGARAVALHIGAVLRDDIAAGSDFETAQTGTRLFDGDLHAFADTGPWRALVGPAPEQIATFETAAPAKGGLGLFETPETPVVLVGTSFSARGDFHFPGFLKSSLSADVISFAIEGQGPFVPMDRFLTGGGLAAKPQFVLWEIPERYLDTWSPTQ